jgi:hypothetical protein
MDSVKSEFPSKEETFQSLVEKVAKTAIAPDATDALQAIQSLSTALASSTKALESFLPVESRFMATAINSSISTIQTLATAHSSEYSLPGTPDTSQALLIEQCTLATKHSRIFTTFLKLPTEIRLKIWKATFPGPRVVEIFAPGDDTIRANLPPPIALSTCRESRTEALKTYCIQWEYVSLESIL